MNRAKRTGSIALLTAVVLAIGGTAHSLEIVSDAICVVNSFKTGPTGAVNAVLWDPLGNAGFAGASQDKTITSWSADRVSAMFKRQWKTRAPVSQLVASPDGKRFAAGDSSGNLYFWRRSPNDGKLTAKRVDSSAVLFLAWTTPNRVVVGSASGRLSLWDPEGTSIFAVSDAHKALIEGLAISPDRDGVATVGDDGWIRTWSARELRMRAQARTGASGLPTSVVWTRRAVVVGTRLGEVQMRRPSDLLTTATQRTSLGVSVTALAANYDGRIAFGDSVGQVYLLDWNLSILLRSHWLTTESLAFSPDGSLLASGSSNGEYWIYELASRRYLDVVGFKANARITSFSWSPNSQHFAMALDQPYVKAFGAVGLGTLGTRCGTDAYSAAELAELRKG